MAEFETTHEYKQFEKLFSAIRSENRAQREDAVGLLTPSILQKYLKSGKTLTLPYGRKGHTVTFTPEDIKSFEQSIKKVKALNRPHIAGLPLLALERASAEDDKMRMRQEIRSANLYKINGNLLTFRVSASGKNSEHKAYQVRIRLEHWHDLMTETKTWIAGARAAAVGNLSFDCTCGRHQYWYRYLATISGCAIAPKEKDFPKIRNPKLVGFCCKHVLKAFQQLKSGSVHNFLAKEMEKQADSIGYVAPGKAKFLNATDLAAMKRARGSNKDLSAARAAYHDFTKARTAFRKKLVEPDVQKKRKAMQEKLKEAENKLKIKEAEALAHKERAKAAERQLSDAKAKEEQLKRDALVGQVGMYVMRSMFQEKKSREQAISDFAAQNNLSIKEVDDIAKGAGV